MSLYLYAVPEDIVQLALNGSASTAEKIIQKRQLSTSIDICVAIVQGKDQNHLVRQPRIPLHEPLSPHEEQLLKEEPNHLEDKPEPIFFDDDDEDNICWHEPNEVKHTNTPLEITDETAKQSTEIIIDDIDLESPPGLRKFEESKSKTNTAVPNMKTVAMNHCSSRVLRQKIEPVAMKVETTTDGKKPEPKSRTLPRKSKRRDLANGDVDETVNVITQVKTALLVQSNPGSSSSSGKSKKTEASEEDSDDDDDDMLNLDEEEEDTDLDSDVSSLSEDEGKGDTNKKKRNQKSSKSNNKTPKLNRNTEQNTHSLIIVNEDDDETVIGSPLKELPTKTVNGDARSSAPLLLSVSPSKASDYLRDEDDAFLSKAYTKKTSIKTSRSSEPQAGPSGLCNGKSSASQDGHESSDSEVEKRKPIRKKKHFSKSSEEDSDSDVESIVLSSGESFMLSDDEDDEKSQRRQRKTFFDSDDGKEVVDGNSKSSDKKTRVTRSTRRKGKEKLIELNSDDEEEEEDSSTSKLRKRDTTDNIVKKTKRSIESEDELEDEDQSSKTQKTPKKKVEKKQKKRKRIKKMKDSSEEDDSDCEVVEDTEEAAKSSQPKHRKIILEKNLEKNTKLANQKEKERLARIEEMQKLYNKIEKSSPIKKSSIVNPRLVLEYDQETKSVAVEVHPALVKCLKPHQIEGIKFMYTSTIESIKRLGEDAGSGCILAHSMGLGKTLQVIAFVHTLLVHEKIRETIGRVLVVCPKNTCRNWASEFRMWLFEKNLTDFIVEDFDTFKTPIDRQKALRRWQRDGGVMIIGDTLLSRLVLEANPDLMKTKAGPKKKKKKGSESFMTAIQECICDPGGDIVIVDEGHKIKNDASQLNKALNSLRTRRRIVLTGTPLQNNLMEYHVMVDFVKPSLLGTKKEFQNRFVLPITRGQHEDSTPYDVAIMKKRTHVLHKLLEGCVQRQDYRILAPYIPEKHEYVLKVKLTDVQQKIYQHYLETYSGKKMIGVKGAQKGYLLNDCSVLRLVCGHPVLLDVAEKKRQEKSFVNDESETSTPSEDSDVEISEQNEVASNPIATKRKTRSTKESAPDSPQLPSEPNWFNQYMPDYDEEKSAVKELVALGGKMALLFQILEMCEKIGDKLIVFSQSLITLDVIERYLGMINQVNHFEKREPGNLRNTWTRGYDYFRIDGGRASDARMNDIVKFNDVTNSRTRLFLLSTRAGCLGINLVGANRCIIFDASWNPTHDIQAIFRIYRFGQVKPIYVYRFVSYGSMEEKVYERQIIKQSLACRVVDEQQIDRHFKANELAELYKFQPEPETEQIPMVPKDKLLGDILSGETTKRLIVNFHEHDSLLEERPEENLTEEERKLAWEEFEREKEARVPPPQQFNFVSQPGMIYSQTSGMTREEWYQNIADQINKSNLRAAQQQQQQNLQQPKTIKEMNYHNLYNLFSQMHELKGNTEKVMREMLSYVDRNKVKVSGEIASILSQGGEKRVLDARRDDYQHLECLRVEINARIQYFFERQRAEEEKQLLRNQQQQQAWLQQNQYLEQQRLLQEQQETERLQQLHSFTESLD